MVLILKNHGSTIVIPLELVFHILSMLPVKTLLRFKSVCKDWYNIINDSYFIKLHLYQSLKINSGHDRSLAHTDFKLLYLVDDIDFPCQQTILHCPNEVGSDEIKQVFDVIGSCNGLLCLRSWGKIDGFIICNPSTRSFKWIYMPITHLGKTQYWLRCGFGYDSKKDDFKIVLTLMKGFEIVVFSYSLKSDTWRVHHSSYYDVIGVVNSTRGPEDLLLFCPAGLFWYDQKHKTFKNFKYETFHCQTVHTYVGSLVSIPGCSQMRLENKCSED
ncbi:F-box protein At5g49610-like [Beta vulgaris subsp. vulgaris]|uniref:F-box protein At5g49610-like n=1 Tax=Beta vulgaris subsp. vulgaris TaxID=3555 RepID=UPI002547C986|nr:F-box protein At5g49610-like [Beta vulgaris subsp. vulgaris]